MLTNRRITADIKRISAYRTSDRYPLVLQATQSESDVLARWREGVVFRGSIVVLLLLGLGVIGFHLVRQLAARQSMATMLAAKEADFRLLAESSSAVRRALGSGPSHRG